MTDDFAEIRVISHYIPAPASYWVEPTAEEREQWRLADERRQAEAQRLRERHSELLAAHSSSSVLVALLEAHAPRDGAHELECHGCPENNDRDYGVESAEWPCPTWTLISEQPAATAPADVEIVPPDQGPEPSARLFLTGTQAWNLYEFMESDACPDWWETPLVPVHNQLRDYIRYGRSS